VRPDLIVFDHSPVALLAARGIPARRALIGTGFWCPPDVFPLPCLRSALRRAIDPIQVARDEQTILRRANWMLSHWKQPPLERMGQLYGEVDECFLTTFAEFDPYPDRVRARYWGPVSASGGNAPQWPTAGSAKRIYAYLKPFAGLESLLEILRKLQHATLIYYDGIAASTRKRFNADNLHFVAEPVDPAQAARECDLAILNGTPGATCDMLLAGKPILQIPIYSDQERVAEEVCRVGAGALLSPAVRDPDVFEATIRALLVEDRFTQCALSFAERHRDFNAHRQRTDMLDRACELIGPNKPESIRRLSLAAAATPIKGDGGDGWTFG
jgi:UDP:flavonoid glycosyltransferase YjiC (YdhE family)